MYADVIIDVTTDRTEIAQAKKQHRQLIGAAAALYTYAQTTNSEENKIV